MQDGRGQQLRSLQEWNLDFVFGQHEEVRLCCWLCCQFPRDFNIPVEILAMYGMCLDLFEDVHSFFEARDRVHAIIDELKQNNFLLDSEQDDYGNKCVNMVYDVPDFLVPIISKFNLETIQETVIKTWAETESYRSCIGISLELKEISEFPVYLDCRQQLRLLQLKCRKHVPIGIFEGMKELRILSLDVPLVLPLSFTTLKQLRALYIKVFKWEDMSEIGRLEHLEILSVSAVRFTDISEKLGLLCNLRLLDLRKMNIARLPQGVLNRMFKLQELYLPLSFSQWGCRVKVEHDYDDHSVSGEEFDYDNDGENINATLGDIGSLPLTTLQVTVPDASYLPLESSIFGKLTRFKILVKSNLRYRPFGKGSMNELQLSGDISDIKASGVCDLLHITEELCLTKVRNLRSVVNQLKGGDYPDLKKMIITECDDLECVFDIKLPSFARFSNLETLHLSVLSNLREIWHGKWPTFPWFENLKQIHIRFCHELTYVFPLSIWVNKGLNRLQSVEIHQCNEMEGIFFCDKMDDKTQDVYFPEELHLYSIPKLVGFMVTKDKMLVEAHDDRSSNEIVGPNSPRRRTSVFDAKEHTSPRSSSINGGIQEKTSVVKEEFSNKEVAVFEKDPGKKYRYNASSSKRVEKRLGSLKKLRIAFCEALRVIFSLEEYHATKEVVSSLEELELYGLQSLIHIWFEIPLNEIMSFKLQVLVLSECHGLYVISSSVARHLVNLQKMHITHCENMTEIVSEDVGVLLVKEMWFNQLKVLELNCMPSLRTFYGRMSTVVFPSLEVVKVKQCDKMENFTYWSPEIPKSVEIQINDGQYFGMRGLNAAVGTMAVSGRERKRKTGQEQSEFIIPWPALLR